MRTEVAIGCPRCRVWYAPSIAPPYCPNCGYETVVEGGGSQQIHRSPDFDPPALDLAFKRAFQGGVR